MKNTVLKKITVAAMLTITVCVAGAFSQTPRLTASNYQVRSILDRIRTRAATLQTDIARSRAYDTTPNAEERVSDQLTALTNAANSLRTATYSRNTDVSTDVNAILDRATRINRILSRNDTSTRISTSWTTLRSDINTLAGYYGVSWNWNEPIRGNNNNFPNNGYPNNGRNMGLTGTYRLNVSQSDNVNAVIDRSIGYYGTDQRDNIRRTLERRLASPEMIAIDKNGRTITMSSSNQQQVTFDADGIARTETNNRGRTITTRVSTIGDNLTIDYTGDRVNDFNVTFDPDRNGRLRVTRKIYLENRNETVSVASVYDRISPTADFVQVTPSMNPNNTGGYRNDSPGNNRNGNFYVPDGTPITATLRNSINTRASQVGDRFTMEVISPDRYRGAIIEGRVSQAESSRRVAGRANIQLDFDTITVNGRRYEFAGLVQNVSSVNGDSVTVNNEGTIRDNSQGNKTATRAGVGAALGAIIGAIAGGGSGAAIGAGVGAGAGVGSVILGGRDTIELGTGSTFTIMATAPVNAGYVRN